MEKVNGRLKNIRFTTTAGPHKVGVTFRRRTFAESDDQQQLFVPGGGQDRVFRVSSFEISGPYKPTGLSMTPSRERIFSCSPQRGDDEQLCAEKILGDLAKRAYRRPLTETDLADLLEYYRDGRAVNGFEEGIRSGITGILASPYFLYRVERVPGGRAAGTDLPHRRPRRWRRSCRSSCGTRFPTTSCSISRCAASLARRKCCASRSRAC